MHTDLIERTFQIIGILNVTPDSYFDGGKYDSIEDAVRRAGEMLAEGADIIEVGGESTGPGSKDVSPDEELRRTIPVIRAIKERYPAARIAIDTYKSAVAREALSLGVTMVNDVTAGRSDPAILSAVASSASQLVLMYTKDPTPRTTIEERRYDDVIATISAFLSERKDAAEEAGVHPDRIILDPGLGHFVSSDAHYSFAILARLVELHVLGCPILVSPSRKSFLAGAGNLQTADRLPGTVAASAIAVLHGAAYIRTHDVRDVRRGCEVAAAIQRRSPDSRGRS